MIEQGQVPPDETVDSFLNLCLRGRRDPAALEAARKFIACVDLDWHFLRRVAQTEGVAPLLYDIVRGQKLVPPPVEEDWRRFYYTTALRNIRLLHELEDVVRHLAAEGVTVIALKGAALVETVYGNSAVRPMADVDLLVRGNGVPTVLSVLVSLGYRPADVETSPGTLADWETERLLRKNGRVPTLIDVHWSLFGNYYHEYTLSMDWFWQTALPARMLNTPCLVLGPEGQLLHLCAHPLYQHGQNDEPTLLWLHDVAEVIAHYQAETDWQQVLARAKAYDLVLPLQSVLTRVADKWHAPIPNDIQEQLRLLRPSPTEVRVFNWRTAGRRPGVAENLWTVLAGMPGWRCRFAYAWRNLFPSPAYMRERYRIPHRILVPFYYPYRWFLGLRSAL